METKLCPDCNIEMDVLLFLGMEPDGYVCPKCNGYFNEDMKRMATVIS